jgi:hypothetical protein
VVQAAADPIIVASANGAPVSRSGIASYPIVNARRFGK